MIPLMHRGPAPDIFFLMPLQAWLAVLAVGAFALMHARARITIWPAIVLTFLAPIVWWVLATSDYRAWYQGGDNNAAIASLGVMAGWLAGTIGMLAGAFMHRLWKASRALPTNRPGSSKAP
jgi:hypothetical protein